MFAGYPLFLKARISQSDPCYGLVKISSETHNYVGRLLNLLQRDFYGKKIFEKEQNLYIFIVPLKVCMKDRKSVV